MSDTMQISEFQKLIEAICAGSVEALWAESRSIADRWHVCGLPALAALLTALPDLRGQPRLHDVWHEGPTRSAVSYAAILLSEKMVADLGDSKAKGIGSAG